MINKLYKPQQGGRMGVFIALILASLLMLPTTAAMGVSRSLCADASAMADNSSASFFSSFYSVGDFYESAVRGAGSGSVAVSSSTPVNNPPLVDEKEAYAVFSNGTLTFYYDGNKGNYEQVYGMRTDRNDGWNDVASQITRVVFNESFADYRPTNCACWFSNCSNLTEIEGMKEFLNTEKVTSMSLMFCGCSNLTTLDVSNFKTDNVTRMDYMFSSCSSLTSLDLSGFNTANVTDMCEMFCNCLNLKSLDLRGFNTENVTSMRAMFAGCRRLTTLDLSSFNTSNVTDMPLMFFGCANLLTIYVGDGWSTNSVNRSEKMFLNCPCLFGSKGTSSCTHDFTEITYARIDGGADAPGYFTRIGEQPWGPVSIAITTLPNKTEYYIGDELNLGGGIVTATFPDNSTKTSFLWDVNVSGFDNTTLGEKTIMVSWLGKETSFTVTVKEDTRTVTNLYPGSTEYQLGTDIMQERVMVGYDNSNTANSKPFSTDGVEISGLNTNVVGVQDVTITYKGYTWSGQIEIYKPVASLDFSNITTYLNLNADEKPYGNVILNYTDGTTGEVDISKTKIFRYVESENMTYIDYYDYPFIQGFYKTLGEHEIDIHYHNASATLKFEYYDGPAPAKPYVTLADNTITFYTGQEIPEGAYELQSSYYFNTPWMWGGYETVVFDESFKDYKPTSTAFWFYMGFALKEIKGIENLNTEKVTDMQYMFSNCYNLKSLDLSGFDVSNVTNMEGMFTNSHTMHTIYVGNNWNLSDNLYSINMFKDCPSLYGEQGSMPISYEVYDASYARIDGGDNVPGYFTKKGNAKANVASIDFDVKPYTEHILGAPLNRQDAILNINFENRETQHFPYGYFKVVTAKGYDSTKVGTQTVIVNFLNASTTYEVSVAAKDTSYAYLDDNGVLTLYYGAYKQGALFDSNNQFSNPSAVNKVVIDKSFANYHPTTCANWFALFNNMTEIKGLENLNTQYVTDMSWMFNDCNNLTSLDISNFNTDNVMDMSGMFGRCSNLTSLDVSNFNTEKVTNMISMFNFCSNLQTIYVGDNWTTKNVTYSDYMFNGCNNLYGGNGTAYNADFIDATYARIDGGADAPGYFTKAGEKPYIPAKPYVTLADNTITFYTGQEIPEGAYELQSSYNWSTPWTWSGYETVVFDESFKDYKPTSTAFWFYMGFALKEIKGIENLNTEKVTDMQYMFYNCFKLESLDLSGWDVSNVTNMSCMFMYNNNLHTIYVGDNWNLSDNLYSINMFKDCPSLYGERGSMPVSYEVYDASYARIDGGDNAPGYFTKKGNAKANVASIDFNVKPYTEHILGEPLNRRDAILNVNFENREAQHLPYNNINFTAKGYDSTKVGTQTVIVNFLNASTTYEVSVAAKDTSYAYLDDNGVLTLYYGEYQQGALFGSENLFDNKNAVNKVVIDKSFADCRPTSCARWFYDFYKMTEIEGLENINTQYVTDMSYMFMYCGMLESLDISSFNTANVTNMDHMFYSCPKMKTIYVGDNWNTDAVTNSGDMFGWCEVLVGGQGTMWSRDNANDVTYARIDGGADAPGYFTKKDAASTDPEPYAVFSDGTLTFCYDKNKPAGAYGMKTDWKDQWYEVEDQITKVVFDKSFADYRPTSCAYWFRNCRNLTTIEGMKEYLKTDNVTNMSGMFSDCSSLTTLDVSNFKTDNVMYMSSMFYGCSSLTSLDLSNFNTENVIDMNFMFSGCSNLTTLDVSNFNTDNVTYMGVMFYNCSSLTTLDLSNFNTEKVTDMGSMFGGCSNLQTIYVGDNWTTKNVTGSWNMFDGCNNLYGGKGTAYNGNIIDATYANIDAPENGKPGYFTKSGEQPFTPAKPYVILADKTITFYSGETIPEGAIELQTSYYFNTPWLGYDYETIVFDKSFKNYKPTSTAFWFFGLTSLKEIKGLENLNTEKVTDMQYMFNACFLIESLDLSGFDVSNVTNMDCMFTNCYNLHTIFVGDNWNLSDNLSSINMFAVCYSLYGEQGSMPESYKIYDASMAQIDGGDNAPGYFTKKGNSKATVTSIDFSVNPYSEHTLGEPINRQSGILNVYFNNREAQYLQYNHVNITPSGYDSTRVGTQTVIVNFLNASTTYEVNVTAKDTSYAYLDDNGVLTLYYGEYQQGALFGSENLFNNPGIVKKVIIDKSFANYHPTTCAEWFQFFNNMTEIKGLENLNTQYVTDMSRMFYSLQSLTTIDVSKLNTENVTSMSEMFSDCNSLTTLDVSNFNTENVTSMSSMFEDCDNLKTIYVGDKWTTKNVTESENMFKYSNNLYGGKGTAYNAEHTSAEYAIIDGTDGKPGYFTKIGPAAVKIAVKDMPKTEYVEGMEFSAEGGTIEVTYDDGTTENIDLSNAEISGYDAATIGEQNLTVAYRGKETTLQVTVVARAAVSIEVTTMPTKVKYIEGEAFAANGGAITVKYNDGTTEEINLPAEKVTITGYDAKNPGEQTLKVVYEKLETSFNVTVTAKPVASIAITTLPTKLEYIQGESLSLKGGELEVTYTDQTKETIDLSKAKASGYDSDKAGDQTVTVTYREKTATFDVSVIAKTLSDIAISKKPTKVEYIEGDKLDLTGGELTLTYKVGGKNETETMDLADMEATGYDGTKTGEQTITVEYEGKTATFKVKVVAKKATKIAVSTLPTKMEYLEGDTLDLTGGVLTVDYNNETTETVELAKATIKGFDGAKPGEQTLKVAYLKLDTTFKVTVAAKQPVEIVVSKMPTKTEYLEGDTLDMAGSEFTVNYNNKTSETVALDKVSVSGYNGAKPGEQTIKVAYEKLETTFKVSVKAKTAVEIAIIISPAKLEYIEGERFAADGGEFVVYYDNKTTDTLSLTKAQISGYDANKVGAQTLIVEYLGQKAEIAVDVKSKNPFTKPAVKDDFYQISNADELMWFMFDVNNGNVDANAKLTNDIVINEDCLKRLAEMMSISKAGEEKLVEWEPIGTLSHAFSGVFDGQGHTISGIYINDKTQNNVGLFGVTAPDAIIKNLGVIDSYIAGKRHVGAVCGDNEGVIVNCYSIATVIGEKEASGIAGKVESKAVVENSYYLADAPKADDPCAKTAADFKNGEVAKLLSEGATINGETIPGDMFSSVEPLAGVEDIVVPDDPTPDDPTPDDPTPDDPTDPDDPSTPVSEVSPNDNIRIWSFERTIYVQNATAEVIIVDMAGRPVQTVKATSDRLEIPMPKTGIYIVKTGAKTQKVMIR